MYHWDVLLTYHWDVLGCFIWDLFETSWRRTTEKSWRRSTETSLGVSFERYLRRHWDVQRDVVTTSLRRLVAGWEGHFYVSYQKCLKPSFSQIWITKSKVIHVQIPVPKWEKTKKFDKICWVTKRGNKRITNGGRV